MTLEHAADVSDIEEQQNERLLLGNREILEHVDRLEEQILKLESRIVDLLERPPTG